MAPVGRGCASGVIAMREDPGSGDGGTGVQDVVGVKGILDAAHETLGCLISVAVEVRLAGTPDPVLRRYDSSQPGTFRVDGILNLPQDSALVQVHHEMRMEISISSKLENSSGVVAIPNSDARGPSRPCTQLAVDGCAA